MFFRIGGTGKGNYLNWVEYMKTEKSSKGLFRKLRARMSGVQVETEVTQEPMAEGEMHQMTEEFEAVKKNPGQLTGWDFDRAFDFI